MKEENEYYLYYEKLMRTSPGAVTRETPEYQALAARYPFLSESIRLRKELEKAKQQFRCAKERPTRFRIAREMKGFADKLKLQAVLVRLHGERKRQSDYETRFLIMNLKQRLGSLALRAQRRAYKACQDLRMKLQEQSRRSRYARASKLPPSLFDMRTLYPADRSAALRDWIEKRTIRIRRQEYHRSVDVHVLASAKKEV